MKNLFNLCLIATLLSFGAACSKKTNSRAKEVIARENALKAAEDAEKEQKALELKQKELETAQKLKIEQAVELSDVLVTSEQEELINLSFYQLLLSLKIEGTAIDTLATVNSDAGADHDYKKEISDVIQKTNLTSEKICASLLKKVKKKNATDLIKIDRVSLQRDVETLVGCRSLDLKSDYIEVLKIRSLCPEVKVLDAKVTEKNAENQNVEKDKSNSEVKIILENEKVETNLPENKSTENEL